LRVLVWGVRAGGDARGVRAVCRGEHCRSETEKEEKEGEKSASHEFRKRPKVDQRHRIF
jgi:hypothetical protein